MSGKASPALAAVEEQRQLSKAELLDPRIREERTYIASLGGEVVLRSLSYALRKELRSRCGFGSVETWDEEHFTMLALVHSIIEPDVTEDDIPALEQMNQAVFDDLVMRITLLNLLGSNPDDAKKGSKTTGSSDSASN